MCIKMNMWPMFNLKIKSKQDENSRKLQTTSKKAYSQQRTY